MATACAEALVTCRKLGIATVCDVNYRGKMWSPEKAQQTMKELLPLVDICIANDEDAPAGLGMTCVSGSLAHGIEERDSYVEMARQICAEYGCKKVASVVRNISCVERSVWMGMLFDAESGEHWFSPAHDVHVLEGVAAGDAFNAGLVHALINDFDRQDAVNYAIAGLDSQAHHQGRFQLGDRRRDRSRGIRRRRWHPRRALTFPIPRTAALHTHTPAARSPILSGRVKPPVPFRFCLAFPHDWPRSRFSKCL